MSTAITTWLSPRAMHALGWTLVHSLWQGTALSALAAAAMAVCRRTSVRYVVGVSVLAMMLLAPFATFFFLQQDETHVSTPNSAPLLSASGQLAKERISASASASPWAMPALDAIPWLVEGWLFGVVFFSLRSAGGFLLLERERRKQALVVAEQVLHVCCTLQDRLGIKRAIQYCACQWLQAPSVIGWFRPIVFLPIKALTGLSEDQLQLVIAHELAHIQRFDPFVNVSQIAVETLLFYHPAVWWLNKRIRTEREHCCDEIAVSLCGNALEYARALTLMEEWRSAPAFAMAANGGPLTDRILRVLGLRTLGAGMRGIGLAASLMCLAAALMAGNVFLHLAHPALVRANSSLQATSSPAPSPRPAANAVPTPKPSAAHQSPSDTSASSSSYIEGLSSVGLTNLSVDTLIALKIQDVTPEYVRGLQDQGLHPDAEKLIAMRMQGIVADYVREFHAAGLQPSVDQWIGMKVQGADAEYYRGLKEAGIEPDVDHLIALKVQGVTPEYVRQLRAAGMKLTIDQVISMKVQDITPEYLKRMHDLGIDLNANDVIAMRVQDVTPEYVRGIQALGLKPSANEWISMRVQDVTAEYVKALQSAGFNVGINDIISAKVQDVTPEFIVRAKQRGFKDLTLQKLIQLRQLGILDSKADI